MIEIILKSDRIDPLIYLIKAKIGEFLIKSKLETEIDITIIIEKEVIK